jgi:hypothetical protein
MKYETHCAFLPHVYITNRIQRMGKEGWEVKTSQRMDTHTEVIMQRPMKEEQKENPFTESQLEYLGNIINPKLHNEDGTTERLHEAPKVDIEKVKEAKNIAEGLVGSMDQNMWIEQTRIDEMHDMIEKLSQALRGRD